MVVDISETLQHPANDIILLPFYLDSSISVDLHTRAYNKLISMKNTLQHFAREFYLNNFVLFVEHIVVYLNHYNAD